MKANAPEKIYVDADENWHRSHFVFTEKAKGNDIEYTRTDAFIEKACEWLSDNLQNIVDVESPSKHHVESLPVLGSITQTEFLNKFREEIKFLFD